MRSIILAVLLTGVGALAPVAGTTEDATPLDLKEFIDGMPAGRSNNRVDHAGGV
jgi:hypothetical protein